MGIKMTGKRSLFKDFPKEGKEDIIPQDLIVTLRQWADSGWLKSPQTSREEFSDLLAIAPHEVISAWAALRKQL